MKLKEAYLEQVLAPPKEVKKHDGEVEECDLDLIKPATKKKRSSKTLVRKVYVERGIYLGPRARKSLQRYQDRKYTK